MKDITKLVILGKRHPYYNRTVDLAKDYYAYAEGGKDMDKMITEMRKSEDEEQDKTRVRISQFRTGRAISKIATQFKRVFRMDKAKFSVSKPDDSEAQHDGLAKYISSFGSKGETLIQDVEAKALYYNIIDPNVIQWNKWNGMDDTFEPFVFSSENCYYYEMKKGMINVAVLLAYMTKEVVVKEQIKAYDLEVYHTFEGQELSLTLEYIAELEDKTQFYSTSFVDEEGNTLAPEQTNINGNTYYTYTYSMGYKELPLMQYGYKLDAQTKGATYVSFYEEGVSVLKEMVNTGSQKDVTQYAHTYPKIVQMYHPCDYIPLNSADKCVGGVLALTNHICPSCKGTGEKAHNSGLDIIKVKAPDSKDEAYIKPNEFAGYINAPIDILEVQIEELKRLNVAFSEAIFGVDLSNRPNNETATANQNYFDTAYDVLYDFTKSPKHAFVLSVRQIANQLDINPETYRTSIVYSNDFNLDTEHQLLLQRKTAVEAGATPETLQSIDDRILRKQNRNNPEFVRVQQAMRKFLPFSSMSEELKRQEIANLPDSDYNKVLFTNFNQITNDIIESNKSFVMMSYEKQKETVKEVTQTYIDMIKTEAPSVVDRVDFELEEQ